MKQRVITGLCLGVVLIPLIILGGWFMFGLTLLLSYVATFELVKMHSEKHNLSKRFKFVVPLFSVMLVALCGLAIKLPLYFDLTDVVFSVILIFALLLICSLFIGHIKTSDIVMFFCFILYGGLGIFMAFSSRFIKHIDGINYDNLGLILFGYVILTTVFTDMGAYTFGLLCGKHKLCPTISPKKTIEGAIGGSFTGALVGSIVMLVGERVIGFSLLGLENELLTKQEKTIKNSFIEDLRVERNRKNGYLILPILCIAMSLLSMQLPEFYNKYKAKKKGLPYVKSQTGKAMKLIMPVLLGIFALFYNSVFAAYMLTGQIVSMVLMIPEMMIVDAIAGKKKQKDKDENVVDYSRKF